MPHFDSIPFPARPKWRPPINLLKPHPPFREPSWLDARFCLLLACAYGCVARALVFDVFRTDTNVPHGLEQAFSHAWLVFYSLMWLLSAVLCIVAAVNRQYWKWLFALAAFPSLSWALGFGWAAIAFSFDSQNINGFFSYQVLSMVIFWAGMQIPSKGFK